VFVCVRLFVVVCLLLNQAVRIVCRGKTHVCKTVTFWERSRDNLPLTSAFTGIVATLHMGAFTCHKLFGLPITNDDTVEIGSSSVTRGTGMGLLLRNCSMVCVDEAFMLR
jgi:hypothetical protein